MHSYLSAKDHDICWHFYNAVEGRTTATELVEGEERCEAGVEMVAFCMLQEDKA